MQWGTAFSAVLFKYDVTDWPTPFFYREKRSALFCCRIRIEKKNLFSCLLQNNLLGVEMLFEIQKPRLTPRLFYFKQHFSISEVILQLPIAIKLRFNWSFLQEFRLMKISKSSIFFQRHVTYEINHPILWFLNRICIISFHSLCKPLLLIFKYDMSVTFRHYSGGSSIKYMKK